MVPHVGTVDSGPKVIRVVWMEKVALEHANTCMGYIAVEAHESVWQRHINRGASQTKVRRDVCELW